MGTNFYIRDKSQEYEIGRHIGKRSAAGLFCFDCKVPLNDMGMAGVHNHKAKPLAACPVCGKSKDKESLDQSSAGLELGFNKNPYEVKQGVKSASSFTFAMDLIELFTIVLSEITDRLSSKNVDNEGIIDEYGRTYTYNDFLALLAACPIHFNDMIGQEFS